MRSSRVVAFAVTLVVVVPVAGACQPPAPDPPLTAITYVPITGTQRVDWIVDGTIGRKSLFVGFHGRRGFLTITNIYIYGIPRFAS